MESKRIKPRLKMSERVSIFILYSPRYRYFYWNSYCEAQQWFSFIVLVRALKYSIALRHRIQNRFRIGTQNDFWCHLPTKTIQVCSKKLSWYCIKVNCIWPLNDRVNSRRINADFFRLLFGIIQNRQFKMLKMMQWSTINLYKDWQLKVIFE